MPHLPIRTGRIEYVSTSVPHGALIAEVLAPVEMRTRSGLSNERS